MPFHITLFHLLSMPCHHDNIINVHVIMAQIILLQILLTWAVAYFLNVEYIPRNIIFQWPQSKCSCLFLFFSYTKSACVKCIGKCEHILSAQIHVPNKMSIHYFVSLRQMIFTMIHDLVFST